MFSHSWGKSVATTCSAFLLSMSLVGQYFSEVSTALGVNVTTTHNNWGCGVSFYDFNKDGWPDLSFSRFNQPPVFYTNNQGEFQLIDLGIPNSNEAKMIVWADYDNDGDADLFFTRYLGPWSLYQNDGSMNMTDVTASVGITQVANAMAFGASWGDINNDGWLDLYISNYNTNVNQPGTTVTNYLFRSDGDGTFTQVAGDLGVSNGSKHTFLTTFVDINRDGWQDLYVANDRLPDSNDLYLNNVNGQFTNITAGSGADIYINTMSNTVGDYDNDGDIDFYVANSEAGNNLLRNNGNNTFTNVAVASGVAVNQFCWGALWMDYNLDGWQDLYVNTGPLSNTPVQNYFYTGDGDGTFTYAFLSGFQGHVNVAHSCATGDYDNDGNPDLLVGVRSPLKCEVWHNNSTTTNNHLKVSLEGVLSNRDGIGSFIDCYIDGNLQTRYTMCGEGFMSQNSQYQIFGLGQAESVDSLKITWLSGIVDVFYDIEPNQWLHIVEGSSFSAQLNQSGTLSICEGESVNLTAGEYATYQWNNGEESQSINVTETGTYSVLVTHPNGLILQTYEVTIEVQPLPDLGISYTNMVCYESQEGTITSDSIEAMNIEWVVNGTSTEMPMQNLGPGIYEITGSLGGCESSTTLEVLESAPLSAEFDTAEPLCFGQSGGNISLVSTTGGEGEITFDPVLEELTDLTAGSYLVTLTDSLGCTVNYSFELASPSALEVTGTTVNADINNLNGSIVLSIQGGTPPYEADWDSGQSGMEISGLSGGFYSCIVTDSNGCVASFETTITVSVQELDRKCAPFATGGTVRIPCGNAQMIEIFAMDGRLIATQFNSGLTALELPGPSGVYLVKLKFKNGFERILKVTN